MTTITMPIPENPKIIPFNEPQISVLFSRRYLTIFIRIFFIRITIAWRWFLYTDFNPQFWTIVLGPIGIGFRWRPSPYNLELRVTRIKP